MELKIILLLSLLLLEFEAKLKNIYIGLDLNGAVITIWNGIALEFIGTLFNLIKTVCKRKENHVQTEE